MSVDIGTRLGRYEIRSFIAVTPIQHGRRHAISVWVTEDAERAEYWD